MSEDKLQRNNHQTLALRSSGLQAQGLTDSCGRRKEVLLEVAQVMLPGNETLVRMLKTFSLKVAILLRSTSRLR